jgi:hypothetical protein
VVSEKLAVVVFGQTLDWRLVVECEVLSERKKKKEVRGDVHDTRSGSKSVNCRSKMETPCCQELRGVGLLRE